MTRPAAAPWRARRLTAAVTLVVVGALVSALVTAPVMAVASSILHPARPVGAWEVCAILLAAVVPALTAPPCGAWERLCRPRARFAGLALTAGCLAASALPALAWTAAVHHDGVAAFGWWHAPGEALAVAAVGWLLFLALGQVYGPVTTVAANGGAVWAQHLWPGGPLDQLLTNGRHNDASPVAVVALVVAALAWWHHRRGLPLGD